MLRGWMRGSKEVVSCRHRVCSAGESRETASEMVLFSVRGMILCRMTCSCSIRFDPGKR